MSSGRREIAPDNLLAPTLLRLREGWRWLCALSVAGLAVGITAALIIPKQFEASALLMVVTPKQREAATPPAATNFRLLAESNAVAEDVVTQFKLDRDPVNLSPERFRQRALIVDEIRGTNLLRVRVRLQDPALAAAVCNRVTDAVVAFQRRLDATGVDTLAEQLKAQVAVSEEKLRAAESSYASYAGKEQVEVAKEDVNARLDQRASLVQLLVDIEAEKGRLAAAEHEITNYSPTLTVPRMIGAENAIAETRQAATQEQAAAQLIDSRRREMEALANSKSGNDNQKLNDIPERQDPAARGRRLSSPGPPGAEAITKVDVTNPYVNPVYVTLQYEIASSRTRLGALERRRRELMDVLRLGGAEIQQIAVLHQKQLEAARRQTEVDIARRIHSEVSMQYEQARINSLTNSTILQVVDSARQPEQPIWPKLPLFAALGLLLGGVTGAVALVAIEGRSR